MTKTGTDIEKQSEQLPRVPAAEAVQVEVVDTEVVDTSAVALAQQARVRRSEIASQVLSLLGSLGNLALRIVELRGASSSAPVEPSVSARAAAQRAVTPQSVRTEPRAVSPPRSGGRGQRRRRRGAG